jgi:hypothetical protein
MRRVFHTIDPAWNNRGEVVFTFLQDNEAEANAVVRGLYLYLINIYPQYSDGIAKCFTGAAIEDAGFQRWDKDRQCVVGAEDDELDELASMDEDFDLTFIEDPDGLLKRKLDHPPLVPDMMSQDSLSTFQSRKKPATASRGAGRAP